MQGVRDGAQVDEATEPRPRPRLFVKRERGQSAAPRAGRSCAFTNGKINGVLASAASAQISPNWAGQVPTRRQGPEARPERGEQGVGRVLFSRQVLVLARWERDGPRVGRMRTRGGIASICLSRPSERICGRWNNLARTPARRQDSSIPLCICQIHIHMHRRDRHARTHARTIMHAGSHAPLLAQIRPFGLCSRPKEATGFCSPGQRT